jgi:MFS family permease
MSIDERAEETIEVMEEEATVASSEAGNLAKDLPAIETATAAAPKEKLPPLWRNRDFMYLWSGQVISVLGSGISSLALPLIILELTGGNYAAAGVAGALFGLPYLLFSLPIGALIDRWERKRVMILCDVGRAINIATIPLALFFNVLTIWQIYINAFIEGTLYVFFNIAEVAALPRVVRKEQLPNAAAQNEAGFIATFLIAPPLGGILVQINRLVPFIFDAVSYTVSAIFLTFIKTEFQGERKVEERHLRREIGEGMSWLWRNPLIRFMAFLTGGNNFVSAGLGLVMIVLAQNMLGIAGTEVIEIAPQIGVIFAIGSVGGILGAIAAPRIQKRFGFGQVIIGVMWAQTLLYSLFAFAPNIIVLGLIMALLFSSNPIYNAVQFSYRLALIPDRLQGRVNSTFRLLAFGFQPLGNIITGVLLVWLGVMPTLAFYVTVFAILAILTTLNTHVRTARPIEEVTAQA